MNQQVQVIDKIALLHIVDRRVLFVRRRGNRYFCLPEGTREPDESVEDALMREVRDELYVDLRPRSAKHLHTFVGLKHNDMVEQVSCWDADYFGQLIPSHEVDEISWFDSNDSHRATEMGRSTLRWLKDQDLID